MFPTNFTLTMNWSVAVAGQNIRHNTVRHHVLSSLSSFRPVKTITARCLHGRTLSKRRSLYGVLDVPHSATRIMNCCWNIIQTWTRAKKPSIHCNYDHRFVSIQNIFIVDTKRRRQANGAHVVGALCSMTLLVVFWTITVNIYTPFSLGGGQNTDPQSMD